MFAYAKYIMYRHFRKFPLSITRSLVPSINVVYSAVSISFCLNFRSLEQKLNQENGRNVPRFFEQREEGSVIR